MSRKIDINGFSGIELAIVIAVLSIFSALAIPAFNCVRRRAISTAAQETIRQIKEECETNFIYGIDKFTSTNPDKYQISSRGSNSCSEGTVTLTPEDTNLYPTYLYKFADSELSYNFKGQTGTSFVACNKLICGESDLPKINLERDFVVKDSYLERECFAYVLVDGPTWSVAQANAVKLGGHLVTVNDAAENKWLYSNFEGGNWIGLLKKDGNWEWINGDKVEYKNWYPGQASNSIHPSNGTIQTYGWIHTDWVGKWDDHFDSNDVGTAATHGIAEIPICN